MKLGTAVWSEGASERTALVAELPSDPGRVVDLNRLEHLRLAKLGEGWAERMAEALVPASLRQLLEGGPRALHRARQVLAYAEKWHRRGKFPESLAPRTDQVQLLACLLPTLALVGLHGGQPAGCCLAMEHARGVILGGWLELDPDWEGSLELGLGSQVRRLPLDAWRGLPLPVLRPAEVLLAPPPHLRLGSAGRGVEVRFSSAFERLMLHLDEAVVLPTMQ